ncbi:MAG: MucB/RseB C-terminal domain-containing protein, partial [candidate division Zixibacteria bacterium]|nr:MucB/RseB C-terminal domain-containing protein [candidate division Zixibacteria bacterium]
IDREMLKPKFSAPAWSMNRLPSAESRISDTGWLVKNQPLGFKKIMEMKRTVAGKTAPMTHIVFSDGLAAVSVFIEPMPAKMTPQGLSNQGAVNVYTRPIAEHLVTVLGETPPVTVMQIGNSVSYQGR